MENISAPLDSLNSGLKIIISQNEISTVDSSTASRSHSKTNIRDLKRLNITNTITSDSNIFTKALESSDQDSFVKWSGSSKNSELF